MQRSIVVLDSDRRQRESWQCWLSELGYLPFVTADVGAACNALSSDAVALLLADVPRLCGDNVDLLNAVRNIDPPIPVVGLAGIQTIDMALEALRQGVLFYLLRPFDQENLRLAIEKALSATSNEVRRASSRSSQVSPSSRGIIVGASAAIRKVLSVAVKVARSDANIVLLGESGSGKELFAQTIHSCSKRSQGEFIPVDCASLPDNLLEAELFGYEKGAFTGAIQAKPGLMELANGGTLFFDEIGELPLALQPKLLRALQERKHRRLGGTKMVNFDVRVISATNRDLGSLVAEGKFRRDLFYRLSVVPLRLPPLRDREGDISLLANHILSELNRKAVSTPKHFAPEVLAALEEYSWPGNVRELHNAIEYCCALAQSDTIGLEDLPETLRLYEPGVLVEAAVSAAPIALKISRQRWLAQLEAQYIADLMKRFGGNISQAAKAADVDRKTFYSLLKKYPLEDFINGSIHHKRAGPRDEH